MQKRINISIDDELNDRWTKVAKRLKVTKSGMVEQLLMEIVPVLEQEEPKDIIKSALQRTAEHVNATASLFE